MAHSLSSPSRISAKRIGLELWMDRVLEMMEQVRHNWNGEPVHDLRVALRRCRTMADALDEVNPSPGWRKLKKSSRNLFHRLGVLRDTQVEREWVKKLGPPGDSIRRHMLIVLGRQEKMHRKDAEGSLDRFDRKDWRKSSRKLARKAQFFPLESVAFQRLALKSLNEAVELFGRARRGRSRVAWHRLRIGLKQFRYIVENFLPLRYEAWGEDLKRMQDLLGDVHDLDVLRAEIRRRRSKLDPSAVATWFERIECERKTRLDEFRSKLPDKEFLWLSWRSGLRGGATLEKISLIEAQAAYPAS
jgi:CHAD domain-containing protein